ncbi:ATP-binding protein [Granulosicoccus sp. 3-233]|uniref:ATP-binding protein n=1 Tax=Granulosicoccus sp. 3-233 TaxID=3417969 RepID=UPI003D342CC7
MKLRSQMLLAAGLTLAVPLVGWQSVQQLYRTLQQTRIDEQTLKVANMRLALSEVSGVDSALRSGLQTGQRQDWYAETSPYPIFVDGYEDDWQTLVSDSITLSEGNNTDAATLRVARHADRLFLFVSVLDDVVEYHVPPTLPVDAAEGEQPDPQESLVNGDSVELLIQTAMKGERGPIWQHGLFRTIAPGTIDALSASETRGVNGRPQPAGSPIRSWESAWVRTRDGYQLEISLPLPPNGAKVGIAVVDVDNREEARVRWAGSLDPAQMRRAHLVQADPRRVPSSLLFYQSEMAGERLEGWTSPGGRSRLYDIHGRLLADVNKLYERGSPVDQDEHADYTSEGLWDAILLRVFAFFVAGDLPLLPEYSGTAASLFLDESRQAAVSGNAPSTSRYVTDENDRVLGTLAPVGSTPRRGYLLYESNEEHASAYAGSELARLFSLLLLVSLLAGCGLLTFALVLSSRIRRLSLEAQHAVGVDGRLKGLPGSDARDEIGDLSRKLSTLLARSADYTHYLEALSSRLSHELRTPLSVVRTSIENIERDGLDSQSLMLIDRASGGADHLGSIIKALVESTRLEQTVQMADMQRIDLADWLAGSLARYRQVYPDMAFESDHDETVSIFVQASPELLSQAFDKLVDNAVSFGSDASVVFSMQIDGQSAERGNGGRRVVLSVCNRGLPLDEAKCLQLFEPMYSERGGHDAERDDDVHLGLGLYVVKMIAEVHDGSVIAGNDHGWVRIGFSLPVSRES